MRSINIPTRWSIRSEYRGSYGTTQANSSPPSRASSASRGSSARIRSADAQSRISPAWWPFTSLIVLKLSRSTMTNATLRPSSLARVRRASVAGPMLRLLRLPVSGSVSARRRARSSALRRSAISDVSSEYRRHPKITSAMLSRSTLTSSGSGATPVPIHDRTTCGRTIPPVATKSTIAATVIPSATRSRSARTSARSGSTEPDELEMSCGNFAPAVANARISPIWLKIALKRRLRGHDTGEPDVPRYWLMKSEPDAYGWDDLVAEGEGTWDGVRNYRARNNLAAMEVGDLAFFYHSNIGKEIVGIVEISASGLPDPTDDTGKWAAVKVRPVEKLRRPVTLKEI